MMAEAEEEIDGTAIASSRSESVSVSEEILGTDSKNETRASLAAAELAEGDFANDLLTNMSEEDQGDSRMIDMRNGYIMTTSQDMREAPAEIGVIVQISQLRKKESTTVHHPHDDKPRDQGS